MTLEEWPTVLAPFLQEKLASYPALAAILWAAAVLCNGGVPLGEQRLQMERHGVSPYHQTTTQVNIVHLESKPFQIQEEGHIPGWNAAASCYTRPR